MMRRLGHPRHSELIRHYLPDLVYGANDGIITTFAVVSGVVGADLSERIILILGFANLLADGFSMGASNFLSRRSYADAEERAAGVKPRATAWQQSSGSSRRASCPSSPTSLRSLTTHAFRSQSS